MIQKMKILETKITCFVGGVKSLYKKTDFKCQSGPRVLGMDVDDSKNAHGENWARLKLYNSSKLSSEVREQLSYMEKGYSLRLDCRGAQ